MRGTMAHRIISVAIVCALWFAATELHPQQVANPTAAALAEFTTRVKAYTDLHKQQEGAARISRQVPKEPLAPVAESTTVLFSFAPWFSVSFLLTLRTGR